VASALTSFLQTAGSYDGLDLAAAVISWCQENISPRFPKFRFGLVDVQNAAYNPAGKLPVSLVVLPFAAGTFDFVIASSFFTHLLAPEAEHYFSEVSRVLRPAGTLVATFFVLDAESSGAVTNQRTTFDFRHRIGPCSTFDPHTPESGVAYDESYLLEVLRRFEFSLRRPIQHGSWRSERGYLTTHDVVVARRSAA
jgi:SAM-dependent methyltransferase